MSLAEPAAAVSIDVLGPLSLRVDGAFVEVPGHRRRAVLATLALANGRVVGTERLIDTLWPEEPPDDAVQALYNHVSRLRRHLGDASDRLRRRGAGYVLEVVAADELDANRARRLAGELDGRPAAEVVATTREALALWRGPALEEFRDVPALEVESVALDELQLRLRDSLTKALVDLGDPSAAMEAAATASADPLRERSAILLVTALAREGRAAEAMAAGASFRRLLAAETGLDPGPELAALEEEVAAGTVATSAPVPLVGRRRVARPSGPLVGRQHDREEILRLQAAFRIVTVTGPGGVGKTRLAMEVAAEVAETERVSVVVVDLAAVDDAARVCQSVASTLGLRTSGEVLPVDVAEAIGDGELLLVLDNCEHVAEACRRLVATLDATAPGVRVLATSRVTLHAPGEYVVRLQPLPVPREGEQFAQAERQPSVRAFVEHARRRDQGFRLREEDLAPLVEVLQHLDGLPLAIELIAGQATMMPVASIRDRLGRALDLGTASTGPEDERQGTLRLTIAWSFDVLGAGEQALLRALAPFPGGVDLGAVEVLAADVAPGIDPLPLLDHLVDASLVAVDSTLTRYRLLFTVRAFLLDDLAGRGESREAEQRFLRCTARTAAEIGDTLAGTSEALADRRLRAELANLRAARDLARRHGDLDTCVEITLAVGQASIWRDLRELWAWCLELADDPAVVGHRREVEVVAGAAEAARLIGDFERCTGLAERALDIRFEHADSPRQRARAWSALAAVAHFRGQFSRATDLWVRGGADEDPRQQAGYLAGAALSATYGGDPTRSRHLIDQARAADALHPSGSPRAFTDYVEGELVAVDDPAAAIPCYLRAIEEASEVGANFVEGVASVALASAQARIGDHRTAAATFERLLQYWSSTGHQPQLWTTARNAAPLLIGQGRVREAVLLLVRADQMPSAAAVDEQIARHSGRAYTRVGEIVGPAELDRLSAEAGRLSSADLIQVARRALADIAEPPA